MTWAMKLHPVTQLILFAVALRLTADVIIFAQVFLTLTDPERGRAPLAFDAYFLGRRFQEFGQTLAYVGTAAWVELLSRWSARLKADRLIRQSKSPGATS
jgi:hypothetical protein